MYSTGKVLETYWCSSSITCQEKGQDWILRILTFNDKNPLYLPIFQHFFSSFEGRSDLGVIQLVIKSSGIRQTSRVVSLR